MVKRFRPVCQFLEDGTPVAVLCEFHEGYVAGSDYDALLAEVDRMREELKLRECEGPAHVCHNLATERAEVRRLRDWQRRAVDELRWLSDHNFHVHVVSALIEEAGYE